jgi:hypothetical protein
MNSGNFASVYHRRPSRNSRFIPARWFYTVEAPKLSGKLLPLAAQPCSLVPELLSVLFVAHF